MCILFFKLKFPRLYCFVLFSLFFLTSFVAKAQLGEVRGTIKDDKGNPISGVQVNFNWDEIHEIAEQLEHINSQKLIDKLDEHLGFPKYDPHGDPIPDKNGVIYHLDELPISQLNINDEAVLVNVKEHSSEFLKYLENISLLLGTKVKLLEKFAFDNSLKILINNNNEMMISQQVAEFLNVSKNNRDANLF